jgi:hypothetical protein
VTGFDHTAHAAQVAGVAEYLAGDRSLTWKGQTFPALIESIPPKLAPAYDRRNNDDVIVAVTIARSLFAAKQVPVPKAGDSFTGSGRVNYRVQKPEGAATDAEARFICTVSTLS